MELLYLCINNYYNTYCSLPSIIPSLPIQNNNRGYNNNNNNIHNNVNDYNNANIYSERSSVALPVVSHNNNNNNNLCIK